MKNEDLKTEWNLQTVEPYLFKRQTINLSKKKIFFCFTWGTYRENELKLNTITKCTTSLLLWRRLSGTSPRSLCPRSDAHLSTSADKGLEGTREELTVQSDLKSVSMIFVALACFLLLPEKSGERLESIAKKMPHS